MQKQDIVKYDEKPEDIKIKTSEISSKFKFFETYRPTEQKRKEFRITPPREGVVKMPTPESEIEDSNETDKIEEETHVLEKSHTTALMLNKFREMEQSSSDQNAGPRPLKCFTPPLDDGNHVYDYENSTDVESQDENEDFEEEDDEEDYDSSNRNSKCTLDDEALKEVKYIYVHMIYLTELCNTVCIRNRQKQRHVLSNYERNSRSGRPMRKSGKCMKVVLISTLTKYPIIQISKAQKCEFELQKSIPARFFNRNKFLYQKL